MPAAASCGAPAPARPPRSFDDDSTGKISFKNLKRVAKELGENMTEEELQDMIDQADRDGDGEINPDEFYRIMKKRGDNPLDDLLDAILWSEKTRPARPDGLGP